MTTTLGLSGPGVSQLFPYTSGFLGGFENNTSSTLWASAGFGHVPIDNKTNRGPAVSTNKLALLNNQLFVSSRDQPSRLEEAAMLSVKLFHYSNS
ncbi:hypothetical protein BgiBS90_031895 [Biomphalaria glabrata]|nr:hypothetical protein BgiBS90_031895 [Biomphalaria glabrata]